MASMNWQVRAGTVGCRQPSRVSNRNDPETEMKISYTRQTSQLS